jgi:hypothetical protein
MTASYTCKQWFSNINKHRYKSHQSSGGGDRQEKIKRQREGQHVRRITERGTLRRADKALPGGNLCGPFYFLF